MGKKIIKGFLIAIASLTFIVGLLFAVVILTYDDGVPAPATSSAAQTTPEPTEPTTPTPPQSRMGQWDEIQIIGDANFVRRSEVALQIIRSQTPDVYEWVVHYVGILRQYTTSGMWYDLDPPEFRISSDSYLSSTMWLAGIIVHDARHSMQAYRVPGTFNNPHSQAWANAEYEANLYQIDFFNRIGAPARYIAHLEELNQGILQGEGWWLTD